MSSDFLSNYEDVLLPKDIQKILHLGRNSVYRFLANGTIHSVRLGGKYLIPKDSLRNFMYPDTIDQEKEDKKDDN
ncbi:MAG: helix-turn-helix domain-containing protein [Lachnospiraceae bacterium]|nr:helix-turn-helix domain-containing protein [Lachnospiraceae bacterium]